MRWPHADDLLRRLGSGIRPGIEQGISRSSLETPDFQALLQRADSGEISSGRAVVINHSLGADLTYEQADELGRAADAAEAAGARTLAAVVDDVALLVDVPSRTASDARPLRTAGTDTVRTLTDIDAAVVLTPTPSEAEDDDEDSELVASALRYHAGRIGSDALIRSLGRSPIPATQLGDR